MKVSTKTPKASKIDVPKVVFDVEETSARSLDTTKAMSSMDMAAPRFREISASSSMVQERISHSVCYVESGAPASPPMVEQGSEDEDVRGLQPKSKQTSSEENAKPMEQVSA